jgi:RNA polymerase sigma-70 factor (ECF subfamily)
MSSPRGQSIRMLAETSESGTRQLQGFGLEYLDGLFGYAIVLTRNRAEAEDLVQEAYVRAMDAMHRLTPNSNIKGWLFTILRNIWFNELRRRRNSPNIVHIDNDDATVELPGNFQDAHEIFAANEDVQRVRSAILQLPIELREIILLREFEDLSYRDIAEVLGCPVGTVMSRLARARARLRDILK